MIWIWKVGNLVRFISNISELYKRVPTIFGWNWMEKCNYHWLKICNIFCRIGIPSGAFNWFIWNINLHYRTNEHITKPLLPTRQLFRGSFPPYRPAKFCKICASEIVSLYACPSVIFGDAFKEVFCIFMNSQLNERGFLIRINSVFYYWYSVDCLAWIRSATVQRWVWMA